MEMITGICNVYINSELKLGLFKETFHRVYAVSDNWLVNIRGKYREEVIEYIKSSFPDFEKNCIFFSGLDDNNWAKSTAKMLEKSKYEYIYVFIEDHFLLKSLDHFKSVIRDMMDSKIEYFTYSFFNVGLSVQSAEGLYPDYSKHFFSFQFDEKNIVFLRKNNHHFYPYSLVSICTKKYFQRLLLIENKLLIKVPAIVQVLMENIFLFYPRNRAFWFSVNKVVSKIATRFIIYPSATPFNLEKSLFDCDFKLLPLKVGGLRGELFANWDDDNILSNSSLIKRGLYPEFLRSESYIGLNPIGGKDYALIKNQGSNHQYCPNIARVEKLPMKYIFIKKGVLKIFSDKESFVLEEGQSVWIHANIMHALLAIEDCVYYSYINSNI
jgi:hypothetical protein